MDKKKQNILIIGGGGREHAIGWKIAQSPKAGQIFFAPGNAGTSKIGANVSIMPTEIDKLLQFAKTEKIDLTLAIPDDPLALGIVNEFHKAGLRIWGPSKQAAQLEWSKEFAKSLMQKKGLPTAKFEIFTDFQKAKYYCKRQGFPIVIKASGLAQGKGVLICNSEEEVSKALEDMLVSGIYGEAGKVVIVEEYLDGPEISIHAFTDGENYSIFPTSQDHKKIGEGDIGANTGGMGSIAPLPFTDETLIKQIETEVLAPTLDAMKELGAPFVGVLYPGLIISDGKPKILEFNSRFGDPETQTYMRLLESDLLEILNACIDKTLDKMEIKWKNLFACTIVLASRGYPGSYEKGKLIIGISEAEMQPDIVVFHAGTKYRETEKRTLEEYIETSGGRVLGVTATGKTLEDALVKAYKAIGKISFEGMQYRKDIGQKTAQLSKLNNAK